MDLDAYAATLACWRDRLTTWRREGRGGASRDISGTTNPFAPTHRQLASRWLPQDIEAQRFVYETLALTQWPQTTRERTLGRVGRRLIPHLVFSISLNTPGRPPRPRRGDLDRAALVTFRSTILKAVQREFRDTPTPEDRADRQAWLQAQIQRHVPRLATAERDRHAKRLVVRRPVDVANWLVGRRYGLKLALVQRLASRKAP